MRRVPPAMTDDFHDATAIARREADAAAEIARAATGAASQASVGARMLAAIAHVALSAGQALALRTGTGEVVEFVAASGALASALGRQVATGALFAETTSLPGDGDERQRLRRVDASARIGTIVGRGGVLVPLVAQERLVGVLQIAEDDLPLGSSELEALGRIAPTLTLALDVLVLTEEDRRQRE